MRTLTPLLLAEIDRRAEWARTTQMGVDPLAIDTLAYLTAFREIVRLHYQTPSGCCNECGISGDGWPCWTLGAVGRALGVGVEA